MSASQKTRTIIRGINNDHDGTRTHNLPIRSRTPYPLGHAAMESFEDKNVFKLFILSSEKYYALPANLTKLQT